MRMFIDADGCPVVRIAVHQSQLFHIGCTVICDTAHQFQIDGVEIVTVDKGSDSTDYAIANQISAGDLVITQDFGLASMCLARGARALHQDGWEYTADNIDALLLQRFESHKYRASGQRMKGPKKRTSAQDKAFTDALQTTLHGYTSGGSL